MLTDDFDYPLPQELIAQEPAFPRDSCRLLTLGRMTGTIEDGIFVDIFDKINPGDCLVLNETRVLPARLKGNRALTGGAMEALLLKDLGDDVWECLVKPARKAAIGQVIEFGDALLGEVRSVGEEGLREVAFSVPEASSCTSVFDAIHKVGEMPLPPYITKKIEDPELYQTVFSVDEHSAAAPTAGLHFTTNLLRRLEKKGVIIAKVRLDVGIDTFRPVTEDDPTQHQIHTEYFEVPQETVDTLHRVKARGGRIIAVGTTATRALESAYDSELGDIHAIGGPTSLYILPGYEFHVIDALITNFHVPRSTLMMLVSAFSTRENILRAYAHALDERYRMLSFGDAMFIA